MTIQHYRVYHLFLVLSVLNLVSYVVSEGNSVIDIHRKSSFFEDGLFFYFLSVSFLIFLIWLTYFIMRKKLISKSFIWLHLFITVIILFFTPYFLLEFMLQMPRRYLEFNDGSNHSGSFERKIVVFLIELLLLATSMILLHINLRPNKKIIYRN